MVCKTYALHVSLMLIVRAPTCSLIHYGSHATWYCIVAVNPVLVSCAIFRQLYIPMQCTCIGIGYMLIVLPHICTIERFLVLPNTR